MPSTSTAERRAMAIAEHHPDKLYAKNRGLLKMSHSQLHDFASTPEKGLPHYANQHPHRNLKGFLHPPKNLATRLRGMRAAGAFKKAPVPRGTSY